MFPYFQPAELISNINCFKTITNFITKKFGFLRHILNVFSLITFHLDFVNDLLIAYHVSSIYSSSESTLFVNFIIIVLWLTTFIGGIVFGLTLVFSKDRFIMLGEGAAELNKFKKCLLFLFVLMICPVTPALIIYLESKIWNNIKENR